MSKYYIVLNFYFAFVFFFCSIALDHKNQLYIGFNYKLLCTWIFAPSFGFFQHFSILKTFYDFKNNSRLFQHFLFFQHLTTSKKFRLFLTFFDVFKIFRFFNIFWIFERISTISTIFSFFDFFLTFFNFSTYFDLKFFEICSILPNFYKHLPVFFIIFDFFTFFDLQLFFNVFHLFPHRPTFPKFFDFNNLHRLR